MLARRKRKENNFSSFLKIVFVISVISFPSPWWIVEGISNSFKTNFEKRYCDLICIVKIFPEINFMFIVQMYFFCIKWLFLYPIFWFFPCWFVWLGVFLILSPSMPFVILWLVLPFSLVSFNCNMILTINIFLYELSQLYINMHTHIKTWYLTCEWSHLVVSDFLQPHGL